MVNCPNKIEEFREIDCLGNITSEPTERWFQVKDYEGFYSVSSLGRVKRHTNLIKRSTGGFQIKKEQILKPYTNKNGYVTVHLSKEGKSKTKYIHSLLCESFLKRPEGYVIDHLNRNRSDNSISNLRYCTQRENLNNLSRKSKTGYTGVSLNSSLYKKRYRARIRINNKMVDLGSYHTAIEASKAYIKAKQKLN